MRLFSNSPLSLRAKRGNLMPTSEIAELVPSETRNLMLQFVSAMPRNRYAPRNDTSLLNNLYHGVLPNLKLLLNNEHSE